jgi:hypothetical protein
MPAPIFYDVCRRGYEAPDAPEDWHGVHTRTGEVRNMSHPVILATIIVSFFCIWMATHPTPPRTRRPDPRERREDEQDSDESSDQLRRLEEQKANLAQVRLAASGRNRWDRADLQTGIGPEPALGDEIHLIWPKHSRTASQVTRVS